MANKGAVIGLAALAFAVWAVYLGGIAAQQHNACQNASDFADTEVLSCSKFYRYDWWLICYELVIIIGLFVVAATASLHTAGNAIMALFAIATVFFTIRANEQLDALSAEDPTGQALHRQRTVVAGLIMTATVNFFVTIACGIVETVHTPATAHKEATAV